VEPGDRVDRRRHGHPDPHRGGERGERVRGIVFAGQLRAHDGQNFALVPGGEAHAVAVDRDVPTLPVRATTQAVGLDVGTGPVEQSSDRRVVRTGKQPILGTEILDQLAEDRLVRGRVRKDVRVIPIDVREDGQLWREMKKFWSRIEDGRRVLVAFEHELAPAPPSRRRAQVAGRHAEPKTRVAPGRPKDPGDQA